MDPQFCTLAIARAELREETIRKEMRWRRTRRWNTAFSPYTVYITIDPGPVRELDVIFSS